MSLLFTYKNNTINNRPYINGKYLENYNYVYGRAQPIKHWRKQLETKDGKQCTTKIETFIDNICDGIKNEYCVGGTNNKKYSGSSILSKKYYSSTQQYLQSRHKTFNQNQTLGKVNDINIFSYNSSSIIDHSNCSQPTITYKPSNLSFKKQGSVSSSLRTLKIRNDSISKNSNSFRNPYGLSGANYGLYHGGTPNTVKDKVNNCNQCDYIGYVNKNIIK